jgi:two-component system, chemotaxis family, CheB/CheR fusion protein
MLPRLLSDKPDTYSIRVWVPGCGSGEEAYSVAIALHECMEELGRHFHAQVFGTDIDEHAVNVARAGLYPESIVADVGPKRIGRHFIKEDNGRYRVKKPIREMLLFAAQNLIKDPPFTKLDLLSCRNLLIYLDTELQKKLLPIFHYSLKPDGILFLGSSETIGQATDLFSTVNKKWKLFRRKPSVSTARGVEPPSRVGGPRGTRPPAPGDRPEGRAIRRAATCRNDSPRERRAALRDRQRCVQRGVHPRPDRHVS